MNILVVHDREQVGNEILDIIADLCPSCICHYATDGVTARTHLAETYYDLVVIDLTIPNITNKGTPGFQVAEDLLQEVMSPGRLMTPGTILGITQDTTALDLVQNNISPYLMAILEEDVAGNWRKQLSERILHTRRSSVAQTNALLTRHDYDVLVLTALDKELAPYESFFELRDHAKLTGVKEFVFSDKGGTVRRGACYAIGRAGQPSAASETQGLLCQLRPRLALMSGFCGGVPSKTDLGNVLIAEMAVDWDYGKWKPTQEASKLYSRPEPISIRNSAVHRLARNLVQNGPLGRDEMEREIFSLSKGELKNVVIKMGPFASGSAVIGDSNVLESIKALNEDIAGVDMESFGFYFACRYPHASPPEFVCIKSVADACGPEKDDRLHHACCYSSAYLAKEVITRHWDFS